MLLFPSKPKQKTLLLCVLSLLVTFGSVNGSRSPFSVEEQQALQKLRPMVADALYRDYMQEDAYLIPWLRRSKLDAAKADKALRKAHQWRKDNKMDTITSEDYSKFEKELPYFLDGVDLEGRPVIAMPFGPRWDIRKVILAGQRIKYNLYSNRMNEIASIKARQGFNNTEGSSNRNIPDWILIVDMLGYNLKQHACLPCVPAMLQYATDWDSYFPAMTSIHLINNPRIFENLLQIMRPLLSERANKALLVYGNNKQEWSAVLLSKIAPDQLRPSFGGTKI